MFQNAGLFFVVVAAVVSLAIIFYYPRLDKSKWWLFVSLGLMMGGALGNLVDRLRLGWVTDFIHIGSFAIFNVADSAVFFGVTLLAYQMWREDEEKRQQEDQPIPAPLAARALPLTAPARKGGARMYTMPTRTTNRRGSARVYDVPHTNGRATLDHTVPNWLAETVADDGRV